LKVNAKEEFDLYAEPGSRIRILIRPGDPLTKRVRFRGDLSDINTDLLANSRKKNPSHPFWMQQKTLIGLEAPLAKYDFARLYFLNHSDAMAPEGREKLMADRKYLVSYPEMISVPRMQYYLDDYIFSMIIVLIMKCLIL
jgi:hypothetical protein